MGVNTVDENICLYIVNGLLFKKFKPFAVYVKNAESFLVSVNLSIGACHTRGVDLAVSS